MNILMFTSHVLYKVFGALETGSRRTELLFLGSPLETHFFVMETYEIVLIIEWIHGLIKFLN